jgi:mannosyltransferase OCH1-like enzyme
MDALDEAQAFEGRGLFDKAIERYRSIAAEGRADADIRMRCATALRQCGRVAEAVAELEAGIREEPNNPWPWHRLGELHGQSGRQYAAYQHMSRALEIAPGGEEFLVNIAATSGPLGWYDVGFSAARQLRPEVGDWWAGARQGALSIYRAEREAVLALLSRRRQSEATTPDALLELAPRLVRLGRLTTARRVAEALIAGGIGVEQAHYVLSSIIFREEGPQAAAEYLQAQSSLRGNSALYHRQLGSLLHEAGRHQELLRILDAVPECSEDPYLQWLRFMALLLTGAMAQLRAYCQAWLTRSPDAPTPAAALAGLRTLEADVSVWRESEPALLKSHLCQFWDKPDIPSDVRGVMLSWTSHNPDLAYTCFDDDSARRFLQTHYGSNIVLTYDACHHPAMKADYFRVAFLYQAGGLYADADELCLRPLEHILVAAEEAEIVAVLSGDLPGYVHNFFLAARPRSRILRMALDDATAGIARALQSGQRISIWGGTGPGLITRAVGRFLATQPQAWEREDTLLLGRQQYASYVRTASQLAYKAQAENNWTVAA